MNPALSHLSTAPQRIRGFLLTSVRHESRSIRSWESETHEHDELIWSTAGVARVRAGDAVWTVPSRRAVWVPSGVPHTIETSADSLFYATFLEAGLAAQLPREAMIVELIPAVRELLLLNAESEMPTATRLRLQRLVIELLTPSPGAQVDLRMPLTPSLLFVAERILADPGAFDTTVDWAERVGLPARELTRAFVAETGLSLTQWRIRARVRASLVPLASGQTVAATAAELGYSNPNTFIGHFREIVGATPAAYFSGGVTKSDID
ncbi:AraC-like DNA-binding protein [Leucobacter komagatae]|uniref:AraC-like DNA-binding protein n=1 Tax=Leucobacter komagatae TaxID=55969 RepID=A0A542Y249_9MICO|nr:helix-turn-helix transcriptional regulator [Leucobacter komagatae]TQL42146.1 AraC-like DNA-binding protein [Leucobacter komagatae]